MDSTGERKESQMEEKQDTRSEENRKNDTIRDNTGSI